MEPFTVAAAALSGFATSILVVLFDDQHRHRPAGLLRLLPALAIAVPLLWFAAYTYTSDAPPLAYASDALDQWHDGLMNTHVFVAAITLIPVFIVLILLIVLVPISLGLTYLAAGAAGFYLARTIFYLIPTLVLIPAVAARNILRGILIIVTLPFLGIRALFFFFTQPPALREMKRVIQTKDARPEDIAQAHRAAKREFDRVNQASTQEVSNATVRAFTHNYHKFSDALSTRRARALASYNRAIGRAADETRRHVEDAHKKYRDKNEETDK